MAILELLQLAKRAQTVRVDGESAMASRAEQRLIEKFVADFREREKLVLPSESVTAALLLLDRWLGARGSRATSPADAIAEMLAAALVAGKVQAGFNAVVDSSGKELNWQEAVCLLAE